MKSTENGRRSTGAKLALTALTVGVLGVIAGIGTWSAFSATTENRGNSFVAGSVTMTDDDGGSSALFDLSDMAPGTTSSACITVTYTGSVESNRVKLYGATTGSGLDRYLNVKVTRGSGGSFKNCAGFTPHANGVLYDDTLENYPDDYAGGIGDLSTDWAKNQSHVYRFDVTLPSGTPNAAQTLTASQAFTWEVRSA
jgi:hypothetical protein